MENIFGKEYAGNMWGFSKKRFFITLGLSVVVWLVSVFIQGATLYKIKFNLFSASACEITGFPFATCRYDGNEAGIIQVINILFWFFVIHLLGKRFNR